MSQAGLGPSSVTAQRLVSFLVLVGFAYGGLAQGGYHPAQFTVLFGVIVATGMVALAMSLRLGVGPIVAGSLLLACSTVVSALSAGDVEAALPALALLAVLAIVGAIVEALEPDGAELIAGGLSLLGIAVAVTAVVGVATRFEPWGRPVDGLWRGSSSLTYSNAAASLIGALLLFTAARSMAASTTSDPRSRLQRDLGLFVMVVGLLSTQSRAGVAAFLVGAVVLALGVGPVRLIRATGIPSLVGSVVAFVLLSSAGTAGSPRPERSVAALVVGAAIVGLAPVVLRRIGGWSPVGRGVSAAVAVMIAGALVAGVIAADDGSLAGIVERRLTLSSDTASRDVILFGDRAHEWSAAADQFGSRPLLGVGPGQLSLRWTVDGRPFRAQFTHNEYLELAATQGIVGLLALMTSFALVADGMRSRWKSHARDHRWAVLSGIVVLLAHSAFDYLWHIPLLPLVVVALASLALRPPDDRSQSAMADVDVDLTKNDKVFVSDS